MKVRIILILILFIVALCEVVNAQKLTWQKLYDGPNHGTDIGYEVCQTTDGNFVVVGGTTVASTFDALYAIKLNSYGDTIWSRLVYIPGSQIAALAATSTIDGGCVLTGQYSLAPFTIKLDAGGNILWQKEYKSTSFVQCFNIITTPDRGFIACGRILSGGGYILKIDSSGNLQWDKIVTGEFVFLNSVENAHNSGYILSGSIYDTPTGDTAQALIVRIDNSGEILWQKRFSVLENANGKTIKKIHSGYLLSGSAGINPGHPNQKFNIFFIRLDTIGNLKFSKIYEPQTVELLRSFCLINDNRYLFANSWDSANITNAKLMITDSSGNILKQKIYHSVKYLYLESAKRIGDVGFIFAGVWGKWGAGDRDDFYVLKTDNNLNAPPLVNILSNNLSIPENYILYPAFPNPFNPSTNIKFEIRKTGNVIIKIYNIEGKEVSELLDERKSEGVYSIQWNAFNNVSGIYFCRMFVNQSYINSIKIILLK